MSALVTQVYAFSIENFKRPPEEVAALMRLAEDKLNELAAKKGFLERNGIRVQVLGDLEMLPEGVQRAASNAMRMSAGYNKAILNICFAYTGRHDIYQGVQHMCKAVERGSLLPGDVTEDLITRSLYTAPHSQVDLLVRTSGETRLSDFLLWQTTLGCVQFQHVLWPDFSLFDLAWAILRYQSSLSHLASARGSHEAAMQGLQGREDMLDTWPQQHRQPAWHRDGKGGEREEGLGEDQRLQRLQRQEAFVAALEVKRRDFHNKFSGAVAGDELLMSAAPASIAHQYEISHGSSDNAGRRQDSSACGLMDAEATGKDKAGEEACKRRGGGLVRAGGGGREKGGRLRGLPQGWWPWAEMWFEAGEGVSKNRALEGACAGCVAVVLLLALCCSHLI